MEINYNIKLFTIVSNSLLAITFILPQLISESLRYSEYRYIWSISRIAILCFHGFVILLTILNISFIIPKINDNRKKYYVLLLCNLPIVLIWLGIFATQFLI